MDNQTQAVTSWKTTWLGVVTGALLTAAAIFPKYAALLLAVAGVGHALGGKASRDDKPTPPPGGDISGVGA